MEPIDNRVNPGKNSIYFEEDRKLSKMLQRDRIDVSSGLHNIASADEKPITYEELKEMFEFYKKMKKYYKEFDV